MWSHTEIEQLYRRHSHAVFLRCRRLLGDEEEALDVMQQVFLRCLENTSQFRGEAKRATYLFQAATHMCLNRLRDHGRRSESWLESAVLRFEALRRDQELETTTATLQILRLVLTQVDPETAKIAIWHYVDGLSQGEIAALTQLSRVTINKRLAKLHQSARELENA